MMDAYGFFFTGESKTLSKRSFTMPSPAPDQVVVKVAGCGLCHTDLGFLSGGVKTKQPPPLILGHEISGTVCDVGSLMKSWSNKNVIIPAVLPCGECDLCQAGRDNICQKQKMPGNDFNGGFASHILVPGKFLCELPNDLGTYTLPEMSVIADAVTTPYQSTVRSGLKKNDLAIVFGVGGVGVYMVQHARAVGAKIIAIDIDDRKLESARKQGAGLTINVKGLQEKELKEQIKTWVKQNSLPMNQWKIFETSGSAAGQSMAFSLLTFASTLAIVGFTMDKLSIRLSNLMAFDADLFGNWGCKPSLYPAAVRQVLSGDIDVKSNVQTFPLNDINQVISDALEHKLEKRAVLVP